MDDLNRPFAPNWASPPGETIQDLLDERHWSARYLSHLVGITEKEVEELLTGKLAITPTLAGRLMIIFGNSPSFWLARDRQYSEDLQRLRGKSGVVIVATCGTFDGELHAGHKNLLETVNGYGRSFIYVAPDWVIRSYKNREPVYPLSQRMKHIQDTGLVNHVIGMTGQTDDENIQTILALEPDIYCFPGDYKSDFHKKLKLLLETRGKRTVVVPRYKPEEYSTTKLHFSQEPKEE